MIHPFHGSAALSESLPLHEIIAKLLSPKPVKTSLFPWLSPYSGTLQSLNQRFSRQPLLDFLTYNLRGIGQVIFVNNPLSGLLILFALFIQSPWVGMMSLVGVFASTLTAIALDLDRGSLHNGIFGYNGILVGAALTTFGTDGNGSWNISWIIAAILLSALTTIIMNSVGVWFASQLKFPPLTLPFVTTTLVFLAIAIWFPQSSYTIAASTPRVAESINWWRVITSIPLGFGQVFLMDKFIAGLLVLLAVALCTPIGAAIGVMGSLFGILAGLFLNAPPKAIYSGLWNYNAVLTAIAIAGVFYAPNLRSLLVGGSFAFLSALIGGVLSILFSAVKLPILTLPFCLATITGFLVIKQSLPSLVPVALHEIVTPEEHYHRYQVAKDIMTTFRLQITAAIAGNPRQYLFEASSPATKGDLKYLFNAIDTDFSDTLSIEELTKHLRQVKQGISEDELTRLFYSLNMNHSGKIDFAAFGELLLRRQRLMSNYQAFMTYFLPIGMNQTDAISLDQMNLAFASVGQPPLNTSEVTFLNHLMNRNSMTWNHFIELLLII